MIDACIAGVLRYAEDTGLIEADDRLWARNRLLEALQLDGCDPDCAPAELPLADLLRELTEDAVSRGVAQDNSVARDLFDTKLMGVLTPAPHEVRAKFRSLYAVSPEQATDWFYAFSQNTNYIRRDRIARDQKWVYESAYGPLDITINLSKPEKDPRAIAAAKLAPQSGYPKCALCAENEGYAGRMNHPARQNHRVIPVTINGSGWYLQYSPYVYYNEHCIVFNGTHTPMKIDRAAFRKLLDFVGQFPHYFVGSNADLPIVGGSILSHDHFQGGHYTFAMERAPVEEPVRFCGFDDIRAGIVKWPMSVLRLTGPDSDRLVELADRILRAWRGYTDESAFVFAETDGEPHNTITPIARRRGIDYELDLVLRNNITTPEHPLGVFHPHAALHHIKKENIGLIEVMGLAVLPARLKGELAALEQAILSGADIRADETLGKHADWVEELKTRYTFTPENTADILRREVGAVFAQVQTDADGRFAIDGIAPGVYSLAYDLKEGTQAARLGDSTFTTEGSQLVMTEIEISENNNYTAPMLGLKIDTSIGGMVWCDNAGEIAPLSGAEVILLDEKGSELQNATTSEEGIYRFDGLMPGNYRLRVTLPNGYVVVEKDDTRLKDGQNISVMTTYTAREGESDLIALRMSQHQLEQNIGAVQPGTLGDFCWLDLNGNGLQDAGELGLGDMRIELWRNDQLVAETTTDTYGYYTFENLYPGVYTLKPIYPAEVVPTRMRTDIPLIASILGENGESNPVQVTSASTTYTADLGFVLVDDDVLPANYGIGEKQDWTKK